MIDAETKLFVRDQLVPFNFVYENYVDGAPYPNLADVGENLPNLLHLRYTWPYAVRCQLEEYGKLYNYSVHQFHVHQKFPWTSWMPIDIVTWDFSLDYIELLSDYTKNLLKSPDSNLKLLFYCHDAVLILKQKQHLDALCLKHDIPTNRYMAVSENLLATGHVDNFKFFLDSESRAFKNRRAQSAVSASKDFFCQGTTYWQAAAITHLHQTNLLDNSHWQCKTQLKNQDDELGVNKFPGLQEKIKNLLGSESPDLGDSNWKKEDSWIHIIFADWFHGVGVSIPEDVFISIQLGRPFVLVGPQLVVSMLRNQGYQTFDDIIDTSYDHIFDPAERWIAIRNVIADIKNTGAENFFNSCSNQVAHNLELFNESKDFKLRCLEYMLSSGPAKRGTNF